MSSRTTSSGILSNELMRMSIEERYLLLLTIGKSRGGDLLATLRAYFAANRNGKAAASALEVSSQTVSNRLRRVAERIGRPLAECSMELEAALLLADAPLPPEQD